MLRIQLVYAFALMGVAGFAATVSETSSGFKCSPQYELLIVDRSKDAKLRSQPVPRAPGRLPPVTVPKESSFVPKQELKPQADRAMNNAYHRLIAKYGRETMRRYEESPDMPVAAPIRDDFMRFVREEFKKESGGSDHFHFLDTPKGFGYTDPTKTPPPIIESTSVVGTIPRNLVDSTVTDHHVGPFANYFDRSNPKLNTTMQVIDFMESALRETKGDFEKAEALVKKHFGKTSTDNLADGLEAIFVIDNVARFVRDPDLRDTFRVAEYFVDFGGFGGKPFQGKEKDLRAVHRVLDGAFPGKKFTDQQILKGIELGKAILQGYNDMMLNPKNGVFGGDRFDFNSAAVQRALAEKQFKHLATVVNDPGARQHKAQRYDQNLQNAGNEVRRETRAFAEDLARLGDTPVAGRMGRSAEDDLALQKKVARTAKKVLSAKSAAEVPAAFENAYIHFGIDPQRVINGERLGLFPVWGASATVHDKPFNAYVDKKKDRLGLDRSSFVLAAVDGREVPGMVLKDFNKQLIPIHMQRYEEHLRAAKDPLDYIEPPTKRAERESEFKNLSSEEVIAKLVEEENQRVIRTTGGRDTLAFNFNGLLVEPARFAMELEAFIGQHGDRIRKHQFESGRTTDQGRSPDDYFASAKVETAEGKLPRLVIVSGIPGSGKSSWTRKAAEKEDWVVLNRDAIRKALIAKDNETSPIKESLDNPRVLYTTSMDQRSRQELEKQLAEAMESGKSIVIDATNLSINDRLPYLLEAANHKREYFMDALVFDKADPAVYSANLNGRVSEGGQALRIGLFPSEGTQLDLIKTLIDRYELPKPETEMAFDNFEHVRVQDYFSVGSR